MKKTLLVLLAGGLLASANVSAKVTAQGDKSPVEAKKQSIPLLPESVMEQLKGANMKDMSQFLVRAVPGLNQQDADAIEAYLDYNVAVRADGPSGNLFDYISSFTNSMQALVALLQEYMVKVLPLYNYLTANRVTPEMADVSAFTVDTVWAAPVDEMFYGLGSERNTYNPMGLSEQEIAAGKAEGAQVKHNQSYLWGMVTVGDKVYWCTNTNYLCVGGASSGLGSAVSPGQDLSGGYQMGNCWVCEFENGIYGKTVHAKVKPEYAEYSDTRIPRIYCYDYASGVVEDITPSGGEYDMMLQNCQGLRSAGAHNGVVFFGGPSLYGSSAGTTVGSSFFALNAETGQFISCNDMSDVDGNAITDIRRWLVYDDVLYCGVRITDKNGKDRGAVLRWYGDKENPWQFKVVGWMAPEAAELEVYNGRMYVGGWNTASKGYCTVNKGPVVPEGGLQPVEIDDPEWPEIWGYTTHYDRNPLSARTTYTAGMKQWKGKLYWGTFAAAYTIPTMAAKMGYTDFASADALAFILGSLRQTSFWRVDENDNIEMLYGESQLPRWKKMDQFDQYGRPAGEDAWEMVPNGYTPVYGRAGYGQLFTAYSWTLEEYHGDLYIGTMNMENLIGGVAEGDEGMSQTAGALKGLMGISEDNYGFELVRFQDPDVAPEYITTNGFGNGTAYGIRNFTKCGDDLFVGSASPLNLKEFGGCHLFRVNEAGKEDPTRLSAVKAAGLLMKRNAENIILASVGGENIDNVTVYDATGRVLRQIKAASHIVELPTSGLNQNVLIVKVRSSKGEWTKTILK